MRYSVVALLLFISVQVGHASESSPQDDGFPQLPDFFPWNWGDQSRSQKHSSKEDSHEKGHGKHHSSSSSSSEEKGHKRSTPRRSTPPAPTTILSRTPNGRKTSHVPHSTSPRVDSTRSTTSPTTTTTVVPTTTSTTSTSTTTSTVETSTKPACGQSVFPSTAVRNESGFVYNPNISFTVTQNASGCDILTISCTGYFGAFISAEWANGGGEVIFPFPVDAPDNFTLVTTSTTLAWEAYGWGATTADLTIKDNTFYCMAGSLLPNSQLSQGPGCACQYETVWVDLMILIEASQSMGNMGLQQMFGYIQTSLEWFNIQTVNSTTDPMHTRIGIVVYGAEAVLRNPLGSLTGDQLEDISYIEYMGGSSTSIDKAMLVAEEQFNSPARRKNARKMIALFATTFNRMQDSALERAKSFQEDDGIMFVYNYVEEDDIPTPDLALLASKGYFWNYENDVKGEGLKTSLCNANCFCFDDYSSYVDSPVDGTPQAGCYYSVNTQSNFRLATNRCQRFNNGSLAQGKTSDKTKFLQSQFEISNSNFWAGIVWSAEADAYLWLDGTPVGSEIYQPWGGAHISGSDCVAIISGKWMPVDCRTGYNYICEAPPCDSEHYCLGEE